MVHVEAGVACQPRLDRWCLVGAVVVTDDVHVQALTDCLVDLGGERFELDGPVPAVQGGDHRPVRRVERREQAGHAVADIVMGAPLGHVRHHGERRLASGQRLDLGLLVDAIDDGAVGRVQVQPDHIEDLVHEQRIVGELEPLAAVGFQLESPPDAHHRGS